MDTKIETITINGREYVPKDSLVREQLNSEAYVIVRSKSAGVFAGYLCNEDGQEVALSNARRLWYWAGAASLSQLAVDGTSRPSDCKFPCAVPSITVKEVIEIIPTTEKAKKSIEGVAVWKA